MYLRHLTLCIVCIIGLATTAYGQDDGADRADRSLFTRLTRQVQRIDRQSDELMDQAMEEARRGDGEAGLETKARLLSLRDERDRTISRMLVLSMRHGWALPDFSATTAKKTGSREAEEAVFGSVDVLVRRRFASEARLIADAMRFPVVSLGPLAR